MSTLSTSATSDSVFLFLSTNEQTINTALKNSYNKVLENDVIAIEQILDGSMVAADYVIFLSTLNCLNSK